MDNVRALALDRDATCSHLLRLVWRELRSSSTCGLCWSAEGVYVVPEERIDQYIAEGKPILGVCNRRTTLEDIIAMVSE